MAGLGKWKKALRNAIDYYWESDIDSDHPDCPECGNTMDFYGHDEKGDFPQGEGYWECSSCGFKIYEREL